MDKQDRARLSLWWELQTAPSLACTSWQPLTWFISSISMRTYSSISPSMRSIAGSFMIFWTNARKLFAAKTPNRKLTSSVLLRSRSYRLMISWLILAQAFRAAHPVRLVPMPTALVHTPYSRCSWSTTGRSMVKWASSIWQDLNVEQIPWTQISKQRWMALRLTNLCLL